MKSYTLSFEWDPMKDTVLGEKLHDSYLEQLRLQTTEPIVRALQKKGYPADHYRFLVRTGLGFCGEHFPLLSLVGTVYDPNFPESKRFIGGVRVFYTETSEEFANPKGPYPYIEPLCDITDRDPVMTCKFDFMDTLAQIRAKLEMGAERFARSITKAIDVPVDVRCTWPDVSFDFHFLDQPDGEAAAAVLAAFAKQHNTRHKQSPIHYVGEPQKRGKRIRVHVDFGGCDPTLLVSVLKAIGKARLSLEKLVLR